MKGIEQVKKAGEVALGVVAHPGVAAKKAGRIGAVALALHTGGVTPQLFDSGVSFGQTAEAAEKVKQPHTAEEAAGMYGADDYTSNPDSWEITFDQDGVVGSHLIPDPEGNHHRIKLSGSAFEGYYDLKDKGEIDFFQDGRRAFVTIVHPDVEEIDTRGGTAWSAPEMDKDELFEGLYKQVVEKDAIEQPGALVVKVCGEFSQHEGDVQAQPKTAEEAAGMYGADDYTSNVDNWEISYNQDGVIGAHLIPDPEGNHHRVNLKGAAVEVYLDLKDDGEIEFFQDGRRAEVLIADGRTVDQLDVRAGTFWSAPEMDGNDLINGLYEQVVEKDAVEQPGALVLKAC